MTKSLFVRTATALLVALSASITSIQATAGTTANTRVSWIQILEDKDLVRVKPRAGISRPATCQVQRHMVFKLSSSNAKTLLATLYTAASLEDAVVRLYGSGKCDLETGAETIKGIVLYPPK